MTFETDDVYVDFTKPTDIDALAGVYNSHPAFIRQHLHRTSVTPEWMAAEIKATRDTGFWSCKVVAKRTGRIIGPMDVKIGAETYLSLLMVHPNHAYQGIGQQVYRGLEAHARSRESRAARLDVLWDMMAAYGISGSGTAFKLLTTSRWNGTGLRSRRSR